VFENEIRKTLEKIGQGEEAFYFLKFPDTRGFVINPEKEGRFLPKVPSDHLVIFKGRTWFLEEKSSRNPASFSFAFIKPHQIKAGRETERAGARYYFLLCNRARKRHHIIYAVNVKNMVWLINTYRASGRESVKWSELEERKDVLKVVKDSGSLWTDISKIFMDGA